jgi:hypothetical protein
MAVEDTAMMLVTGLNLHSLLERYNEGALHFSLRYLTVKLKRVIN